MTKYLRVKCIKMFLGTGDLLQDGLLFIDVPVSSRVQSSVLLLGYTKLQHAPSESIIADFFCNIAHLVPGKFCITAWICDGYNLTLLHTDHSNHITHLWFYLNIFVCCC